MLIKQKLIARVFTTILLIGVCSIAGISQDLNKAKLDSLMDVLASKDKAMGSLTLSKNGKVVYSRAIGFSVISGSDKIPATVQTRYRIGSISKMFTATMIFQLVEEGKLTLATTLDRYFPQLPNAGKITVGNLLNHRSGIHNFTDGADYLTWMTVPKTQEEMLAIIARGGIDFQPNEKFSYSNSNYVILGYIVEKVSKLSYSDYLGKRITSRIGLSNTYAGHRIDPRKNESFSFRQLNGWQQTPETDMSIPAGAGAIVSTPTDLNTFIDALFSLKLVSDNSLKQMKTMTDGFGMGMFQIPFHAKMAFGHNGGIDGFASVLAYFPEDDLAVAYCTNGQVYPMNDILIGVLSIYFGNPYSIPTFMPSSVMLTTEDLDKYLGVYSSTQIPLKITITKDNTTLIAQATGQSSFPLEATEKNSFKFDPAGIRMEFSPEKKELTLKQGGQTILFTREE